MHLPGVQEGAFPADAVLHHQALHQQRKGHTRAPSQGRQVQQPGRALQLQG